MDHILSTFNPTPPKKDKKTKKLIHLQKAMFSSEVFPQNKVDQLSFFPFFYGQLSFSGKNTLHKHDLRYFSGHGCAQFRQDLILCTWCPSFSDPYSGPFCLVDPLQMQRASRM